MLPPPKDPNFKMPETTEMEFLHPTGMEDEQLLETGAWDDDEELDSFKDDDDDDYEEPTL